MNKKEIVITLFEHFYKIVYREPTFSLRKQETQPDAEQVNAKVEQTVTELIASLYRYYGHDKTVGVHLLIDYMSFQWNYWQEKDTKRKVRLSWIAGDKALERWKDRHPSYEYYYRNNFYAKYGVNQFDLLLLVDDFVPKTTDEGEEIETPSIFPEEEVEKRMFDGIQRLVHCIEYTTLFNPKSKICIFCSQKKDCRSILENRQDLIPVRISRGLMKVKK